MRTEVFTDIPDCAKEIRKKVFVEEQGFTSEFDDKDEVAVHLVTFDESEAPVATCRVFEDCNRGCYVIGRIAVLKEYRGKKLGAALLTRAERYVKENGGKCIVLHAQQRVAGFYKKSGFTQFGGVEYDEGCPHIPMKKYI